MPQHTIEAGDTFQGLALRYGFAWKSIAEHPDNAALAGGGLRAGATLAIPELRERRETCAPNRRHRFTRVGVQARLRLELRDGGAPLAGEPYELEVDGERFFGRTDADGCVVRAVPAGARACSLSLRDGRWRYTIDLAAGAGQEGG